MQKMKPRAFPCNSRVGKLKLSRTTNARKKIAGTVTIKNYFMKATVNSDYSAHVNNLLPPAQTSTILIPTPTSTSSFAPMKAPDFNGDIIDLTIDTNNDSSDDNITNSCSNNIQHTSFTNDAQSSGEQFEILKTQLNQLLSMSRKNYMDEILAQPSLKHAHIYCKVNHCSGQMTGPLIERYIKYAYQMSKNKASSCAGDLQHAGNKTNFEIKASTGGRTNNKFNYVQIRMNHECEYIMTAYYLCTSNISNAGELFIFKLTKPEMASLVLKYGGYAHGTKQQLGEITEADLKNPVNNREYAIRPKYGGDCWTALLQHRIFDI